MDKANECRWELIMFRCVTELKGIAVDIDSFGRIDIDDWIKLDKLIPCIFLTTKDEVKSELESVFGNEQVIKITKFERLFSPNKTIHFRVLNALGIKNTELAYLSCNHSFIENANGFLSGTIWITDSVSYQQASNAPDMIRNSIQDLKEALENKFVGFYGEMCLFPRAAFTATMLPVEFEVDDEEVPLYVLGRYFGYSHYMNHLHPYSTAIYYNKKQNKNYTGVFDDRFKSIYATAIKTLKDIHGIDCVCAVPVKPGKIARFDGILDGIASECEVDNIGKNFVCTRDYPDQKSLSTVEREHNIKGAFEYQGDLSDHAIALIDDIASTGATIKESIRELKRHGADEIVVILLAINQFSTGAFWSADTPQVTCPKCGSKMVLQVSGKKTFFFSCLNCWKNNHESITTSFDDGWMQLCNTENAKFEKKADDIEMIEPNGYSEPNQFSLKRIISCPYCHSENEVDIEEICSTTSYERQMGREKLYEFNTDEVECSVCKKNYHLEGYIGEYPQNTLETERIRVDIVDRE